MAEASEAGQVLLAQRLRDRARGMPGRIAYLFLREDGTEQGICYAELAARVDALAAHMLAHAAPGERALLLCPAGIDFIVAFLACLAAGIVAVPAAPAHRARDAGRLAALLEDAAPALVLCAPEARGASAAALARAGCRLPLLHGAEGGGAVSVPPPWPAAVAFLQYTSGSTGQPKGVEVTHANIAANVEAIGQAFGFGADTVMVSWLPPFHDMGLIGSIAAPLMLGFRSVLMAPGTFLRRPAAWLEAITRYRATCSGGPNFAWELCLRRVDDAHKAGLDLASLDVFYNGAEPVRAATLERFIEAYGACGLRREALFPCYGMAEATLLVAGGPRGRAPRMLALDAAAIERSEVCPADAGHAGSRLLVSCGPAAPGVEVAVVDPPRAWNWCAAASSAGCARARSATRRRPGPTPGRSTRRSASSASIRWPRCRWRSRSRGRAACRSAPNCSTITRRCVRWPRISMNSAARCAAASLSSGAPHSSEGGGDGAARPQRNGVE